MSSLYLSSGFLQGSLLLSAADVVSHACTLACTLPACHVPHCSHTDPLLGPHPRPNSKHNLNQPKKHPWARPPAPPLQPWPASPGLFQGLAFKGDYILKRKPERLKIHPSYPSAWENLALPATGSPSPARAVISSCFQPPAPSELGKQAEQGVLLFL